MTGVSEERPALLIIDMVKDSFREDKPLPITPLARRAIEPLNQLIGEFRERGWPIVFSTDAFHEEDFIFMGRMKPHSLAGTEGAEVIDELSRSSEDLWLPKPRFSAFFRTDLDKWLRERAVTLCAVCGINTNVCVLATAFDALSHDFKAWLVEDCTASFTEEIQESVLSIYRRNPLNPLFRIISSRDLVEEVEGKGEED